MADWLYRTRSYALLPLATRRGGQAVDSELVRSCAMVACERPHRDPASVFFGTLALGTIPRRALASAMTQICQKFPKSQCIVDSSAESEM